jgi:hypothetical protein
MAPAEIMRPAQRHNLLIAKAHAGKHVSDVIRALRAVGQPAARRQLRVVDVVRPAAPPGDFWAAHLAHRDGAGERPEVGVGEPGVGGLHGLEEAAGVLEAGVGGVAAFGFVAHAGAVGAAGVGFGVVGAGGVPVFGVVSMEDEDGG